MNIKHSTRKLSALFICACALITAVLLSLSFTVEASAEDGLPDDNYVVADGEVHEITDAYSLVDADLALLRHRAKGNASAVHGVINGERFDGYEKVYTKVYDMLLALYKTKSDKSVIYYDIQASNTPSSDGYIASECPTGKTQTSTVLWKIEGTVKLKGEKPIASVGRVIIISETGATIELSESGSQFSVAGTATLSIQGRSESKNITLKSTASTKGANAIDVDGGGLYLRYCDLNEFRYGSKGYSVICFPEGNYARYLYMSDSSLQNISASEAPGIFCKVYSSSSNTNAKKSELYINNSEFLNCLTSSGASNTVGGSAIRSYAADHCKLEVRNCIFENNRVGSGSTAQNGTATGGGAIYWKSVSGSATLIDCTFKKNSSTVVGGAILNMGTMEIVGCHFEDNTALKNGGAIAVETPYTSSVYNSITDVNALSGTLTLDANTKIISNTASDTGGGIYFNAVHSQIGNVDKEGGRPINRYQMRLEINGAELRGNEAGNNGGGVGIYLDYQSREYATGVEINEGSIVLGNSAGKNGGAIWIKSSQDCECKENDGVVMNGGAMSSNTAANGGAIYIETVKDDVEMNYYIKGGTVKGNEATQSGGAAYIQGGSVIMSAGEVSECVAMTNGGAVYVGNGSFSMSAGAIRKSSAEENGGAVYVSGGDTLMSGGEIVNCSAVKNGGAIYMTAGEVSLSGDANIRGCSSTNGGAVYMGGGEMLVSGGMITENVSSENGGGAYLSGGEFTVTGGTISKNSAINGGGALVANGNVTVKGGMISSNKAAKNGGAFSITNGNYTMSGGEIVGNAAIGGDGGAIYVSSTLDNTQITIRSGVITDNKAGKSGGALGIYGQDGVSFTIVTGSNTSHNGKNNCHASADNKNVDEDCSIIKNNSSEVSGGGIYLSGSYEAVLNMYCLVEEGNSAEDRISHSNFMMVEGGTLNISTVGENGEDNHGNVVINSSIHVTGGQVTISGSGSNPLFRESVTVDVNTAMNSTFTDNREGGDARTIQYFENFEKNGEKSGKYVLIDFVGTEPHVVRANMYSNTGYEVEGWLLMTDDGNGNLVPSGKVYKAGDTATETGKLIFYAKWVVVGYTVVFTPGVNSYIGSMPAQDFEYSEAKSLQLNAFINVGYRFVHWVDSSDSSKVYTDGMTVSGLSETHGTTITLVAVWIICEHDGIGEAVVVQNGSSAKRECACLGYSEEVTLKGVSAVYNALSHAATVSYSRNTLNGKMPSRIWSFEALYYGESNYGSEVHGGDTIAPVLAGSYTAKITVSDAITLSAAIVISRAELDSSPEHPEYDVTVNKNGTDTTDDDTNIIEIKPSGDASGLPLEYQFSWYQGETLKTSEWILWSDANPPQQVLSVTYTNYYVDVRYAETENFKASSIVRGTSVVVWTGDVTFKFSSDTGLSHSHVVSDGKDGITVTLTPLNGYYIYNIVTEVEEIPNYTLPIMDNRLTGSDSWVIWIHDINHATSVEGVTIEMLFSGAEKLATVGSSVANNESFGDISDTADNVVISGDSAYTVGFSVENYKHYENPAVRFSNALPIGSSIIMIDMNERSYWYYTAASSVSEIKLSDFTRMGSTNEKFSVKSELLELQFVVDFSNCEGATLIGNITTSLTATPIQPMNLETVPALPTDDKTVTLVAPPSFGIQTVPEHAYGALTNTVEYQFAYVTSVDVGISKWDNVSGILVIKPDSEAVLPPDARLQVKIGEATVIYPLINGKYTVALTSAGEGSVMITLLSDMIPNESLTYGFTVSLFASETNVNSTPGAEAIVLDAASLTYTVTKTINPVIKADVVGELPRYENESISSLTFEGAVMNLTENHTVRGVLYSKNENGKYTSTTQTIEIEVNGSQGTFAGTLSLESFKDDMYQEIGSISLMLSVEIVDANGKVVDFVPLYFVLVDTRQ